MTRISEAVRVATIMDQRAGRSEVNASSVTSATDGAMLMRLKLWIRQSSYVTSGLFQGSVPMQVGAVKDGGKGKKSKKGKSKTSGDKGKGKGNRRGQGQDQEQ